MKNTLEGLQNERDTLIHKLQIANKQVEHWNKEYTDIKKEYDTLKIKLSVITEERQTALTSYADMQKKCNVLQNDLDTLKKDMQTTLASYADMQSKNKDLEKLLDEHSILEKKTKDSLKSKLEDVEKVHQYYINALQERLDIAEEALKNIVIHTNKLDVIRLEEYKIAHDALEKIKIK